MQLDGDKIIVEEEDGTESETIYEIKGDKLTLTEDGVTMDFTRLK